MSVWCLQVSRIDWDNPVPLANFVENRDKPYQVVRHAQAKLLQNKDIRVNLL